MRITPDMEELVRMSRSYGEDSDMIQAGGGNTSLKNGDEMWVKASGMNLKDVKGKDDFVAVDLRLAAEVIADPSMLVLPDRERDARVTEALISLKTEQTTRRPSIETFLHVLMGKKFVAHTHPLYANVVACAVDGKEFAEELFDKSGYIWLPYRKPGYPVASELLNVLSNHRAKYRSAPDIVFMQNHGLIVAGGSFAEIEERTRAMLGTIMEHFGIAEKREADVEPPPSHGAFMNATHAVFDDLVPGRMMLWSRCPYVYLLCTGHMDEAARHGALYPDHIVYCGESPLILDTNDKKDALYDKISAYMKRFGYEPRYAIIPEEGVIIFGGSDRELGVREEMLRTHVRTVQLITRKSSPHYLAYEECRYLAHWEAERFRQKSVAQGT